MADSSATAAADAGAKRQKRPRLAKLADGLQAAGVERLPQKKYFRCVKWAMDWLWTWKATCAPPPAVVLQATRTQQPLQRWYLR